MNIIIHCADGSVLDYPGLEDHISIEKHLDSLGFEIFPDLDTPKWCDNDDAICVRSENDEYEDGEYDVAEEHDGGDDDD